MRYTLLLLLLAAPLAGQSDSVRVAEIGRALVFNGEWVRPPLTWEMAYAWVEKCTRRRGDFSRVRWAVADSITMNGDRKGGIWLATKDDQRLVVYDRHWVGELNLIVHEMIHDVGNGDVGEFPPAGGGDPNPVWLHCLPELRVGS